MLNMNTIIDTERKFVKGDVVIHCMNKGRRGASDIPDDTYLIVLEDERPYDWITTTDGHKEYTCDAVYLKLIAPAINKVVVSETVCYRSQSVREGSSIEPLKAPAQTAPYCKYTLRRLYQDGDELHTLFVDNETGEQVEEHWYMDQDSWIRDFCYNEVSDGLFKLFARDQSTRDSHLWDLWRSVAHNETSFNV